MPGAVPVVLLSGFLGSGKTTLLSRLLRDPAAGGTLVLVNEIGEVGLDHDLLWAGGEVPLLLENGCVCCSIGDDLLSLLEDLFWARLHRRIPAFSRVVLETTGIADPRGIVAALGARPLVAERYRFGGLVTTAAVPGGIAALDFGAEAAAQIALADRLVMTKTDLSSREDIAAFAQELSRRNPLAQVIAAEDADADVLLDIATPQAPPGGPAHTHFAHDMATFTLPLADQQDGSSLAAALDALAALAPRLLRAKGIVRVGGAPWLVEIAGGAVSPPRAWPGRPDSAATGRLVIIGRGLAETDARAALADLLA